MNLNPDLEYKSDPDPENIKYPKKLTFSVTFMLKLADPDQGQSVQKKIADPANPGSFWDFQEKNAKRDVTWSNFRYKISLILNIISY